MADKKSTAEDSFWDLSRLVPPKKRPTLADFAPAVLPRDVTVSGSVESDSSTEDRRLHIGETVCAPKTYSPAQNLFLTKVTLTKRAGDFNFYYRFCEDAKRLFTLGGNEVPYVPFFSYMPQYSQMNRGQLAYYLYWRGELLRGTPIRADEGYLYLFAYECINLASDLLSPEEALHRLLVLWRAYTDKFPKINKYLSEWTADLCMVYQIPLPREQVVPLLSAVYQYASFREFFFGALTEISLDTSEMLLALLSDYDFHGSRYAKGETKEAYSFRENLVKSMFGVFHEMFAAGSNCLRAEETKTLEHSAFCGALVAQETRIEIRAEYHPFSEVGELREQVTAALKYSENQLRAKCGYRSRLSVPPLHEEYRRMIDAFYRVFFPSEQVQPAAKKQQEPAYMRQYDPTDIGIELTRAGEIESRSWETTHRLTPEEFSEVSDVSKTASSSSEEPLAPAYISVSEDEPNGALSPEACAYLRAVLAKDRNALRTYSSSADRLSEEINALFLAEPRVGDVVLVPSETGYELIADYEDEVRAWMQSR